MVFSLSYSVSLMFVHMQTQNVVHVLVVRLPEVLTLKVVLLKIKKSLLKTDSVIVFINILLSYCMSCATFFCCSKCFP